MSWHCSDSSHIPFLPFFLSSVSQAPFQCIASISAVFSSVMQHFSPSLLLLSPFSSHFLVVSLCLVCLSLLLKPPFPLTRNTIFARFLCFLHLSTSHLSSSSSLPLSSSSSFSVQFISLPPRPQYQEGDMQTPLHLLPPSRLPSFSSPLSPPPKSPLYLHSSPRRPWPSWAASRNTWNGEGGRQGWR